jgi:recombination protein RecA
MSQALRKLCSVIAANHTAVIFINQLREKIGVRFGNPETTPGGRALKFYATVRIDLRIAGRIKDGNSLIGHLVRARVVKNKVAPPFRQAEFEIIFGHGISREGEILDLGDSLGLLSRKGSWYQWDGQVLGQGRESARKYLIEHHDSARQIEGLIRKTGLAPITGMVESSWRQADEADDQPDGNHDGEEELNTEMVDVTWQSRN